MPRKKVPEVVPPEEQAAGLGAEALPESEPMDEPGSSPPDSAAESAGVMVPAIDGPDLPPGTGTGLEDGCETHGDSPDLPQEVPGASAPADSSSGEAPTGEAPLPPPVSEGDASPSVFPAESLDELLAETEAGTEAAGGDSFTAGLLYGIMNDYGPQETIEYAAAASCLKQTIELDFNLSTADEVKRLVGGDGSGRVQR